MFVEQGIEFLAVVMLLQMANFVEQNIVDAMTGRADEGWIEID